jgi:hypothetical protein
MKYVRQMALLAQRGPDEPANSWVFWTIAAVIVAAVLVTVLVRVL